MLRFASLGSGSKGNGTLIESGKTRLLLDCGFTLGETERRLHRLGCPPQSLTAILITHEHGDHAAGAGTAFTPLQYPCVAYGGHLSRDA